MGHLRWITTGLLSMSMETSDSLYHGLNELGAIRCHLMLCILRESLLLLKQ